MSFVCKSLLVILVLYGLGSELEAQIYTPSVLRKGQVDTSSLTALAQGIYAKYDAVTEREKAEAIWRFFLTDGRFVKPGFWYHIAGWAYEEPAGEVLDPLKLLNSYGFGLCYHIAPLLEAVWEAGGFPDARVWFLTGHTVAEVYYGGAYHYYDSDMMGYNPLGKGPPKTLPVASVHEIEEDGDIILGKLKSPTEVDKSLVDYPWYPADLRASAMKGLAGLFTSTSDNWLFPYTRYSQGHSMDFVLRPGEQLIRYFRPESEGLYYLPYKFDGKRWQEFPREIARYRIRTEAGPQSQKDGRRWATGRIEYKPVLSDEATYYPVSGPGFNENLRLPDPERGIRSLTPESPGRPARAVFEMPSPYVIIDANVSLEASLKAGSHSLLVETSIDSGKTWEAASTLWGPHQGRWQASAAAKARSEHGTYTAVSGSYGYLVRLTMRGPGPAEAITVDDITITTRFQLNPRSLPHLKAGPNELVYRPGAPQRRWVLPVRLDQVEGFALRTADSRYVGENGQSYLLPPDGKGTEFLFELAAPDGSSLSGFDAGGRFLDIRDGIVPDKLTAEVRKAAPRSTEVSASPSASLAWSTSPTGDYTVLWRYEKPQWKDKNTIDRTLRWPEVDRKVRSLPPGTRKVYVRYQIEGMALDDVRLAVLSPEVRKGGHLEITHLWREDGRQRTHVERVMRPESEHQYVVKAAPSAEVTNDALIFSCR